jgi:GT2 family glycosyltransferase
MSEQQQEAPSVAVVVLNWNGTADTLECLRSLARLDYPEHEIIVVDNGSRTSPRQALLDEFPGITYLETGRNLGYAGGNNVGIRCALATGHDYVFVLNNDTVVEPDVVRRAVAVAESDHSIGALSVKITSWDDPGLTWIAYGEITYRQGLVRLIGHLSHEAFDEQKDVEWIPGTAMLFARAALETVGLFDEEYFAYHEDVDWCTAARKQGFRIVYAPVACIFHKGHRSSGGKGFVTPRQYLAGRNMVLYVRKHATARQAAKFIAFQILTLPFQYLRRLATWEQAGVSLKVRGMLDGWRQRPLPLVELGFLEPS